MSRIVKIPVKGSHMYDMLKTRCYVSVRNGKLYHKFHSFESFEKWLQTGYIEQAWGESVLDILKRDGYVC